MIAFAALTSPVDLYCERTSAAFWAEPLNAVSNAAFLLAALWGAREARRRGEANPGVWALVALAAAIGVGSFLFHTYATAWAGLADTIPIWVFVALYAAVGATRLGGVRPGRVLLAALLLGGLLALWLANGEGGRPSPGAGPPPLNGSLQYAPAVVVMVAFAILTQLRRHPLRGWVLATLAAFLLSLTARTLDMALCPVWPAGLHWIWHLMNGLVIALALQILVRAR